MAFKKWKLLPENPPLAKGLAEECGISILAASVLVARGHTSGAEALEFLAPEETLSSPFALPDMEAAADRIQQAVDDYEKITVYGDYDCDGVTATALLYTYLSSIGADVEYYIPERIGEGYGMNKSALERIAAGGTGLIVTVDNGISALEEADYAAELGMDLVITDHHQPGPELPQAVAVVDPHRADAACEFREYAGVGVAFQLVAALEGGSHQAVLEYFADLAAVGTIGDIVPLVGENRVIVKAGLRALEMSDNMGLRALMEAAGAARSLSAQTVAFSLVPRINAAGRMGSARDALRLLLCEEEEEARILAEQLDGMNKSRQEEEQSILSRADEQLARFPELGRGRLLILKGEGWSHGVLGIVCSRLLERTGKPVLLMTSEEGGMLRGSGRSLGDFHLFKALSANSSCLTQFGGHKLAAGFSLREPDFERFRLGMEDYAARQFDLAPPPVVEIDRVLSAEELTVESIGSLAVLEPFGARNEPPLFLLRQAYLERVSPLSGNKHQKLHLRVGTASIQALWFGVSSDRCGYRPGDRVDIVVSAGQDEFNGVRRVSLKVRDIRPSGFEQEKFFNAKGYYEKIRRGEPVSPAILKRGTPAREEVALVYRFLKAGNGYFGDLDSLPIMLAQKTKTEINYCKLRLLLDILEESGLISISPSQMEITMLPVEGKVDLKAAPLYQRLSQA